MIDPMLHFFGSTFVFLSLLYFSRNFTLSICLTLFIGISKEIFLDASISTSDILFNLLGVLVWLAPQRHEVRK